MRVANKSRSQSTTKVDRLLARSGTLRDEIAFDEAIEQFNRAWKTWKPSI
ncbi:MAG: hypothetical protein VSS75_024770 [Candidatus Parabeggiatoa sp.]|nr:hypothetical protein [Candidatus Parabeggiatoa sp.]